ncbi:hypothetical protein BGP84_02815 [Pseudomonas putida]|uniref:Uncharacterized protein n=1 Tax=Pseudomonas putida TaxID=303 RepID=A0A2S3X9Y4_PSEPU|nr:hypothetical protein BGP85_24070 [Pseudomonas putida]POG12233.1 hypothetical protein BGP84_02815 [Pseudomonas putida]
MMPGRRYPLSTRCKNQTVQRVIGVSPKPRGLQIVMPFRIRTLIIEAQDIAGWIVFVMQITDQQATQRMACRASGQVSLEARDSSVIFISVDDAVTSHLLQQSGIRGITRLAQGDGFLDLATLHVTDPRLLACAADAVTLEGSDTGGMSGTQQGAGGVELIQNFQGSLNIFFCGTRPIRLFYCNLQKALLERQGLARQ